jgi:hypothetical protein
VPPLLAPEAAEEKAEEEEEPVLNRFVPIEESGLLDDEPVSAKEGGAATAEATAGPEPQVEEPVQEVEALDTLMVSSEGVVDESSIAQTQLYDRDMLTQAMREQEGPVLDIDEEDKEQKEEEGVVTTVDDSEGESFLFQDQADAGPAVAEQEEVAEGKEAAIEMQQPLPEQEVAATEEVAEEDVIDMEPPADRQPDDDSLITGQDVIEKLDNMFGFNK